MENLILYRSPFIKKRVGKDNDGGYLISMLPNNYDAFISGGISNDISFETKFLDLYPDIRCYAFDGTISGLPADDNRITFIKKNLGDSNNDTLTNLHEYIEPYDNIFMKMDIEGHEFKIMPTIIKNNLMKKIKQLVIEIHTPADIHMFPNYFKGLSDINNDQMFDLFKEINNTHTLVHFHANNGCNIQKIDGITLPHVFELTYIRNDFVNKKIKNTDSLPTSLDMKNIESKDDYKLEGFPYSLIEADCSDYNIGCLVILDNDNFERIVKIENEIVCNNKKFYLIYVKQEFEKKLLYFLIQNNITNIKIVIYDDSDNLDYTYIKNKHKDCIEGNSDYFYNSNEMIKDYVFYTVIYNIKSKFDFSNHINWGKNLLKFIENYKLVIFTDKSTLDVLKNELNIDHPNISIIIKNLNELEFQHDDIFLKNTDSKYFPGVDISPDLIKVWINRHLLVKNLQKLICSSHYCYIDWGYIREDNGSNIIFDHSNISNEKIYIGLIQNNNNYLQNIINKIKDFDKENIEETLVNMLVTVGGGFTLIPYNKVNYWYYIYKLYFNKFISENIDLKDDQTIIRQIVFDQKEKVNFNLITDYTIINWFPFINFLQKNDNEMHMKEKDDKIYCNIERSINNFYLDDYKQLFFDIFYKDNNIHLILPIYNEPIDHELITITINNEKLTLTQTKIKNSYEPILIYIYNYVSIDENIIVNINYNNINKQFTLKNNNSINKYDLALTTLFKDDYKLFPNFHDYYKNQGVSHFFMYYNGKLTKEIIDIFNFNDVTLIEWNYRYFNDNTCLYLHHAQMGQMHHSIYRYGKNISEYMIFCDLDEYLHIKNCFNIKNYILSNKHIDKFGFCNKWSVTLDNIYLNKFPNIFLTSDTLSYPARSKNIYKINSINTIGIHDSHCYENDPESDINDNLILFHFYKLTYNSHRFVDNSNTYHMIAIKPKTTDINGRLSKQIIRNLAVSLIAKKHNLSIDYSSYDLITELGIELFSGTNIYNNTEELNNNNYFSVLNSNNLNVNVNPNNSYFYTKKMTNFLYNYLHTNEVKSKIIQKNPFNERYNNNNDLFIHIRVNDSNNCIPGITYYLNTLKTIGFDNGYVSTDNKDDDTIKQIFEAYPSLKLLSYDEIKTIQFASTCKHILLSHGSFSAIIGYLSFFSTIYYSGYIKKLFSDMFSIPNWIENK